MKLTHILVLLFSLPAFAAHSVTLTWTGNPVSDHYKIYRATVSGGPYQLLGVVNGTASSFVNGSNPDGTPLVEGQTYFYSVSSVSTTIEGDKSPEVSATIPSKPAPPTNLKATAK